MTTTTADPTRPVRAGEELDATRLAAYLRGAVPGLESAGEHGALEITQFPAGHSNLTYLVVVPLPSGGRRELVLRRPPFGSKVRTAHDMGREVKILGPLSGLYPKAPRPVAYCDDVAVLGAPFYVMERVHGVILRRSVPTGLDFGPEVAAGLSRAFVAELAALHGVQWRGTALEAIARPEGYARRQVEGWTRRWRDAKTDEVPEIERVAAWLAERLPPTQGATLVHNDFKYDNLVLDPADLRRIVGVLDWEMSTVGDPLMDLGVALGYWVEDGDDPRLLALPFGPTNAPGTLRRRDIAQAYAALTGRDVSDIVYYFVFALFKTAVVLQQIYARWKQGLTQDARFGMLGFAVAVLADNAASALDRQTLDPRGA